MKRTTVQNVRYVQAGVDSDYHVMGYIVGEKMCSTDYVFSDRFGVK